MTKTQQKIIAAISHMQKISGEPVSTRMIANRSGVSRESVRKLVRKLPQVGSVKGAGWPGEKFYYIKEDWDALN